MVLRAVGVSGISCLYSYRFDRLGMPAVRVDPSSDGPTVYRLVIPVTGRRRPFEVAVFHAEDTAKAEAERLRAALDA
jgi:hypothetical protein